MPCLFKDKPRWTRRKEARPQELLAAALEQFVARGYAATRLEDVARQAGVSKGTLYLYFANKEELFKAVVRENMLPVLGEAAQMIDRFEGGGAALFREILHGWWQRVGATELSGISKLMIAESGNFPALAKFYHDEVIVPGKALIVRMLEHGIARGEFRPHDARHTAEAVVAPMLMLWKHSFRACQADAVVPEDFLDHFIDLCLHGLLAGSAHSPTEPLHAKTP